jgi:hypothetical protein
VITFGTRLYAARSRSADFRRSMSYRVADDAEAQATYMNCREVIDLWRLEAPHPCRRAG